MTQRGTVAYLGLGANLGDRERTIARAIESLSERCEILSRSSLYETQPEGHADQPPFLNCAIALRTALPARGLLALAKRIEQELGRVPSFPCGPRAIDIDILLYGDLVLDEEDLKVPHPRMHLRRFALAPLCEIAPDAAHPVLRADVRTLLSRVPETAANAVRMRVRR